jgi:hypothetical protein
LAFASSLTLPSPPFQQGPAINTPVNVLSVLTRFQSLANLSLSLCGGLAVFQYLLEERLRNYHHTVIVSQNKVPWINLHSFLNLTAE